MRGISEKTLQQKLESLLSYQEDYELLKELIAECKELNPWLPIDENTPKDRELLIYFAGNEHQEPFQNIDYYAEIADSHLNPTHYQDLPDDPEPGDNYDNR